MPPPLTSSKTLLTTSPWWCRSPKRGSTKVKFSSLPPTSGRLLVSSPVRHKDLYHCCLCFVLPESPSSYVPYQAKSSLNSDQRHELDFDTSSEEHVATGSPSPPPPSSGPPSSASSSTHQHTSLSSQDSRTSSVAKISQPPANMVQQCLERAVGATATAPTAQHPRSEPNVCSDPAPPALPPKTRKTKLLEAPKLSEFSDWGDSDMDEETFSSNQEKLKIKKVQPLSVYEFMCCVTSPYTDDLMALNVYESGS